MKKNIYLFFIFLSLSSCSDKPSSIVVQNRLSKVTVNEIEWGPIHFGSDLLPGQTSKREIEEDSYSDINFPASYPLKFYINLNGDKIYVQTRRSYTLGKEQDITIYVDDSTKVFSPLIEK